MSTEQNQYGEEELKLFDDIKSGRKFDLGDELPPFYKKHLLNLLWMQGDSEYAGALGYMPWIEKAPSLHEKVLVAQIVKDEMRHAQVVYRLLDGLGEKTLDHTNTKELGYKIEEDEAQIGFKRVKDDYRVNIFYYNIKYWHDFILFNFLMDRAAGHQLEDTLESSYLPWKKNIAGIFKEETFHVVHGDKWIGILAQDPKEKPFLQERLNLWWPRVMNVFGSTRSQTNDLYVRLGLKKRTNGEIRQAFLDDILPLCKKWGLEVPDYKEADQPT